MYQILFIFTKLSPSPPRYLLFINIRSIKNSPGLQFRQPERGGRRTAAPPRRPARARMAAAARERRTRTARRWHAPPRTRPAAAEAEKDGTRRRNGRRNGRNRTGRRGLSPVATGTGPVATRLSPVNARRGGGGSMRRDEECAAICSHNRHTFRAILTVNTANFATP